MPRRVGASAPASNASGSVSPKGSPVSENLTRVTFLVPLDPEAARDGVAAIGGALSECGDKPWAHSTIVWVGLSDARMEPASPNELRAFVAALPRLTAPQERLLRAVVAAPDGLDLGDTTPRSRAVLERLITIGLVRRYLRGGHAGFEATTPGRAWTARADASPEAVAQSQGAHVSLVQQDAIRGACVCAPVDAEDMAAFVVAFCRNTAWETRTVHRSNSSGHDTVGAQVRIGDTWMELTLTDPKSPTAGEGGTSR